MRSLRLLVLVGLFSASVSSAQEAASPSEAAPSVVARQLVDAHLVVNVPAKGKAKGPGGDCTSNLTNFSVGLISARRYPIVDVEQQVVLGMGIFLRKPGVKQLRNLLAEWFFVDDGRIRNIWASMFYPTNDLPVPNWPPYDGNFPIPAEFAAPAAAAPGRGATK